jgi:hypothetical protein
VRIDAPQLGFDQAAGNLAGVPSRHVEPLQNTTAEIKQVLMLEEAGHSFGSSSPSSSIVVRPSRSFVMISSSFLRRPAAAW